MSMSMFNVLQTENSHDTVRIHHISLLQMIIGRGIYMYHGYTRPPQSTKNEFIRHPYAHGYASDGASDGASYTNTTGCGDQDTASIHDVSLPPVHIGRTQCIRHIP
jgi:hypothetical protein